MTQLEPQPQSDRETFVGWMADHRGIVIKIVRGFTTDSADADDLTQDISLALWRSVTSFRGDCKVSTWIWRIALNQALTWQRTRKGPHLDIDDLAASAADRADDRLLVDRIYQAIWVLAPVDRSLIMLLLEGYRHGEIAEITGLSETNVATRLSRARTKLSQLLEDIR